MHYKCSLLLYLLSRHILLLHSLSILPLIALVSSYNLFEPLLLQAPVAFPLQLQPLIITAAFPLALNITQPTAAFTI